MKQALLTAGSPSQIVVYPNTPHGFYADYRPSYRKEQAEDAWKRLQGWVTVKHDGNRYLLPLSRGKCEEREWVWNRREDMPGSASSQDVRCRQVDGSEK